MDDFKDKVVIVTGGNAGIGLQAAKRFAERGARVLITGRREGVLRKVEAENPNIIALQADSSDYDSAERIVNFAVKELGGIDVLVNNAGAGAILPVEEINYKALNDVFNVNVFSAAMLAKLSIPYLEKSGGSIINISSTFGHKAGAQLSIYGGSKAAIEYMTKSWALELAAKNIRVNAIAPGPTESQFLKERMRLTDEQISAVKEQEKNAIPLGRRGVPEDVAHWIVEVASPRAKWLSGQIVSVDGGLSES
ncbi:SDR family oxidoreductase [Microbulbifer sp. SAOS-129_SWC]|uniref:SDR family NAD(P)-dependent oxidoreductase n=1 Tax=Microbulbifer sp. SAOS-129_SWC TaxID=3145235 RepID=UPI0032174647